MFIPKNLEVSFVSVVLVKRPNKIADVGDQSWPISDIIKKPVEAEAKIKPNVEIAMIC